MYCTGAYVLLILLIGSQALSRLPDFPVYAILPYCGLTTDSCCKFIFRKWFQHIESTSPHRYQVVPIQSLHTTVRYQTLSFACEDTRSALEIFKLKEIAYMGDWHMSCLDGFSPELYRDLSVTAARSAAKEQVLTYVMKGRCVADDANDKDLHVDIHAGLTDCLTTDPFVASRPSIRIWETDDAGFYLGADGTRLTISEIEVDNQPAPITLPVEDPGERAAGQIVTRFERTRTGRRYRICATGKQGRPDFVLHVATTP